MTDIHLDTSWCPVCECEIPPRRLQVPVPPPLTAVTSGAAVKSSMTTRGKNGTIKARSGLVQGTGRTRPALNRANSTRGKVSQVVEEPVRTRTVIDPEPTPLYCSEECRMRDLEDSWPVVQPSAHAVLDAPTSRRPSRVRLDAHPSQINPACASPPPPSPTLPPVPPNSLRIPMNFKSREGELSPSDLSAFIQEADEHSDSSSATGTSFTASDRSPIEEFDINDNSNLYTDPQPPPLMPLPLHPHRPSAPVARPGANRNYSEALKYDRGVMMTAKRLQEMIASDAMDDERTRAEKREREEKQRKETERLRRWDFTGEMSRSSSNDREKNKKKEEGQKFDPLRWTEVIYQYNATTSSNPSPASPGIPSTHRRASDTERSKVVVRAPDAPNRTQSALELYAKYPLFVHSASGNASGKATKSSASLATSYAPAYGITASSSSNSVRSSATSGVTARTPGASALTLPGVDPELYAGKRLAGPRRQIAEGLEGKLCLPDVLLRPPTSQLSSSLPSGSDPRAPRSSTGVMRRSGSEASVSGKKSGRSASTLGAVRESEEMENGVWRCQEEGSEDSRSSATRSSTSEREWRGRDKKGKSRASSSGKERPVVEAAPTAWNYDTRGPLFDAVPPLPETRIRFEEFFVPDPLPSEDPPATTFENEHVGCYIKISTLHKRDNELSRRPIRELGRRRGQHEGRTGWWIEKEWEVRAIPERKKLFLFGGAKA
ncbi:hypothetical protein A7U60_g4675 [Sanghuangporus baumii]|uniref:Uncharacterized protein n=1 Tax=Sanghuangporus baumii TaxID=108892 RepID=A0A9Q5N8Y2_SANBA|nr:hypothetical protein A7U60_g4675 [Sanghuangporus baumii]